MSHSHHGGGSSTTGTGAFKRKNRELAEAYWYLVAGAVGLAGVVRAVDYVQVVSRRKRCHRDYTLSPSRPTTTPSQIWATTTAITRELSYPQLLLPGTSHRVLRHFAFLSPPPLGRSLVLLAYSAVIIYMATAGAVIDDVYYWERIGFRNAWISVTQVPLSILLASKISPLTLITGISAERLNWLHRWVSRALFVTATVHGFHFWTQWVQAEYVELTLEVMPMVKYGLGAWAVLLWNFATSFYPLRSRFYELFVIQHIISAVAFLWVLSLHIPPVAMYNLWLAVAFWAFDRAARWALLLYRNTKLHVGKAPCQGRKRLGHEALVRVEGDCVSVVTVRDAHFNWRPGQYVYLWMPTLGPLEAHPYTIACARKVEGECVCNSVELVVRRHGGFSKRLHAAALKAQGSAGEESTGTNLLRTTAFVAGPYGNPPRWDVYDTVILISASTGASFTMPILEDIARCRTKTCLRRVEFVLSARREEEACFYVERIGDAIRRGADSGAVLRAHVAITGSNSTPAKRTPAQSGSSSSSVDVSQNPDIISSHTPPPLDPSEKDVETTVRRRPDSASGQGSVVRYTCRLDIPALIREPVEAALGETLVVVCGGRELVAGVRNCVARLSDERAVHKGTGAQGICLHVEEFSF